jgi:hypothetical protein
MIAQMLFAGSIPCNARWLEQQIEAAKPGNCFAAIRCSHTIAIIAAVMQQPGQRYCQRMGAVSQRVAGH